MLAYLESRARKAQEWKGILENREQPSFDSSGGLTEKSYQDGAVPQLEDKNPQPAEVGLPFGGQAGLGLDIWVLWAGFQRMIFKHFVQQLFHGRG